MGMVPPVSVVFKLVRHYVPVYTVSFSLAVIPFLSDVNECTAGSHTCDVNAVCINTVDSFDCTCQEGFDGDGTICASKPKLACNSNTYY